VPTLWLEQGCTDSRERLRQTGWDEVVVKPAVSIGAIGALRARAADAGCVAHLQALVEAGDVLVQPYVASVAMTGEASLIFFDGRYSHAVRKQPKAGDYRVQDMYGGTVHAYSPSREQLDIATAALALTPEPTTYARADLVQYDGKPAIMELELIEPELFLGASPDAALRFAETLLERLRTSRSSPTE
jgi:glutathione synthase/RimK-type ligase-like ATP-grasp enzyme